MGTRIECDLLNNLLSKKGGGIHMKIQNDTLTLQNDESTMDMS
jgi:hypothetical protein